jgi:ATP-dependent DNA ligase
MAAPLSPHLAPMLARLSRELPEGDYVYEPKWDGFRCLAFVSPPREVDLRSRNQRPLARYFPELVEALRTLPRAAVLDGEIVVSGPQGFDFPALLSRLHPSATRVARLRREAPAMLVAFDLAADGDEDLCSRPFEERRARLEALLAGAPAALRLTPATRDVAVARRWLARLPGPGIDGVVAKRRDLPYAPGRRTMVKVKRERTADCVVGGFRRGQDGREVASLLLGLYADDGLLHYAGHASSFSRSERERLTRLVEPLVGPPGFTGDAPGGPSRWARGRSLEWTPVRPVLVVEVAWRHASGGRFRHGVRLVRFRPDKAPRQCTFAQLEGAADGGDLDAGPAPG